MLQLLLALVQSSAKCSTTAPPSIRRQSHRRRNDDVQQRQWQEHLPGNAHQLVVAKTRQCGTKPDVKEEEKNCFQKEPENAQPEMIRSRSVRSAKKERGRKERDHDHGDVFAQEVE